MKRYYLLCVFLFSVLLPVKAFAAECSDITSTDWALGVEDILISSDNSTCTKGTAVTTPINQSSIMFDTVGYGTKTPDNWLNGNFDTPIKPSSIISGGPEVSVQRYADFATAISSIGATKTTLVIDVSTPVTASVTIPSNITLRFVGTGILSVATGVTVIMEAAIDAPPIPIFTLAGTGVVNFALTTGRVARVYVQWWGAVGDGVTDDAGAIQSAIDAANRGEVFFPRGVYKSGTQLNLVTGVYLVGETDWSSYIKSSAAVVAVNLDNIDSSGIKMLNLDGNTTGTKGIVITNTCNKIVLEDIRVHDYTTTGVEITNSIMVYIDRFEIKTNPIGIDMTVGNIANVNISNGFIQAYSTSAIDIDGSVTPVGKVSIINVACEGYTGAATGTVLNFSTVRGLVLINVSGEDNANANFIYLFNCMGTVITGGSIVECKIGIKDNSDATIISGVYFNVPTSACISLDTGSSYCRILGNYYTSGNVDFADNSTAKTFLKLDVGVGVNAYDTNELMRSYRGIKYSLVQHQMERANASDITRTSAVEADAAKRWQLAADGKQEWGNGTDAVDVNLYRQSADKLKTDDAFINNTPIAFTSTDATPTVGAGNSFKTAGTTAITDFDDGVVGQTIVILATANITITDGAPIMLSGGANFAMTDGDTLTLHMFNDQIWNEISRSVN